MNLFFCWNNVVFLLNSLRTLTFTPSWQPTMVAIFLIPWSFITIVTYMKERGRQWCHKGASVRWMNDPMERVTFDITLATYSKGWMIVWFYTRKDYGLPSRSIVTILKFVFCFRSEWGVGAGGLGGSAVALRFGHCQFFRAAFPFFGQKSLLFYNLGSERKSSALLDDVLSVDIVLFVPISMSF